jgi:hypothetical protein
LKSVISKDGSTVVLDEATFDLLLSKDMKEALNAVIKGTTISGDPASGIIAQFPATIPADVVSAGYKVNSSSPRRPLPRFQVTIKMDAKQSSLAWIWNPYIVLFTELSE